MDPMKIVNAHVRPWSGRPGANINSPVADAVNWLLPRQQSNRRKVDYYLGATRVCRGFYQHCLGMSDRTLNNISQKICGKVPTMAVTLPRQLTYKPTATQLDSCVAFWRYFFGHILKPPMERRDIFQLIFRGSTSTIKCTGRGGKR